MKRLKHVRTTQLAEHSASRNCGPTSIAYSPARRCVQSYDLTRSYSARKWPIDETGR
jgi:hypothetical protein